MSSPRILLLGATGYTGDLTARSLVHRGARPVLVARNRDRLDTLAIELGGLDTALADVDDPASVRAVVEPGDVLISTVGPFLRYGRTAVQTAAEAGVHYLDSTGEGPFIREVFERWGPLASRNGVALLPAFGYDFVPGALAAALALDRAGPTATAVEIAYFSRGFVPSGGTRASTTRVLFEENFAFRDGALRPERAGKHIRRFHIDGQTLAAASIPAAEHLGLPQAYPQLRDITVMLGFPRAATRALAVLSRVAGPMARVRPLANGIVALADRVNRGSTGGPDTAARARGTATVVATASGPGIRPVTVTLRGPNPYDITADLLAWGAMSIASGDLLDTGALGPLSAFGADALVQGCSLAGMSEVPEPTV